ncbi:TSCPD domain-containing protein [Saccharopolyspora sp. 5N708]|uniref:TSCPD domain-containing protein n=1 Tax=Saccharopolyspora sp. 5N708 TaxID=3457424 RepID=UPI003FD34ABF
MARTEVAQHRRRPIIRMEQHAAHQQPPRRRHGYTVRFDVGGVPGHLTTNAYPDGKLGELWVHVDRQGSPVSGFLDSLSAAVSLGLQHGVPLERYVARYVGMHFEPCGQVSDPDIGYAHSVPDYVFRRLALDYLDQATCAQLGIRSE